MITRSAFVISFTEENRGPCEDHIIFGLRTGSNHPTMSVGDIIIVRRKQDKRGSYGVRAIWTYSHAEPVLASTNVPWRDGPYDAILHCNEIVRFPSLISEYFGGKEKVSKILDMPARRLHNAIVSLTLDESQRYFVLLLSEVKRRFPEKYERLDQFLGAL